MFFEACSGKEQHEIFQTGSIRQQFLRTDRCQEEIFVRASGVSSRHIHFINYKDEGEFINWPTDSISGGRQVGNRQQEGRCHFLDFKSSQRCYSILNAALGSRTVYAKLQLGAFNLLSILYGLLARNYCYYMFFK